MHTINDAHSVTHHSDIHGLCFGTTSVALSGHTAKSHASTIASVRDFLRLCGQVGSLLLLR